MSNNRVGKTIFNRVDWGRWIVSSIRTHKARLLPILVGRMALNAAEWEKFLDGQAAELDAATEKLWSAEHDLATERSDDPAHRAERDHYMAELVEVLISVRSLLESTKPELVQRFGLDGRMPRGANELESFARHVMQNLRKANQNYDVLGIVFSTTDLAARIEAPHKALETKLIELKDEDRKAEGLLVERDRALDTWTRVYQVVATLMESIYRMAGEDELVRRVRPTIRRTSGLVGPDDADEEGKQDDQTADESEASLPGKALSDTTDEDQVEA